MENSGSPYFSIVIPTYNRARWVVAAIHSALAQEYADFEIIVVDDGSTDNTATVVGVIKDPRLFFLRKDNGERGAARNYGARKAKGRYINFFDSDDLMYPHHLATAFARIREWGNPEFFHLGYDFKDHEGKVTRNVDDIDESISKLNLFDNVLSCNGVFVRHDIAEKHPFEENRVLASAEDWELWIRLISRYKLYFSNDITTSVVTHDQRSIFTISPRKVISRDELLIENLRKDPEVMKVYGGSFRRFVAERISFWMLCLAENRQRTAVLSMAARAISVYPLILASRRFLASIRKIVLNT